MALPTITETYTRKAFETFLTNLVWDQLVRTTQVVQKLPDNVVTGPNGALSFTVSLPVIEHQEGSTTEISLTDPTNSANNTSLSPSVRLVNITLKALGSGYYNVTAQDELTSIVDPLWTYINDQALRAAHAFDLLVASAAKSVPANDNTWTYAGKNYNPISDGLIHLGGSLQSKTAENAIDSSDTLSAELVRMAAARLSARGVPRLSIGGSPQASGGQSGYYIAVVHPNVELDLKNEASAGAWQDVARFIDEATGIKFGVLGVWEGFLWLSSTIGTYVGTVGADTDSDGTGQKVYRTYFFGPNFLAKAYLSQDQIPSNDDNMQVIPLGDMAQIRIKPSANDRYGFSADVVWTAIAGAGILMPEAGFAIETAASIDPVD